MSLSPAAVPASFIRDLEYDPVQEMLSLIGAGLPGVGLDSPPLGCYILLELSDNEFFRFPLSCSSSDIGRALFIFSARQEAAGAVSRFIADQPEDLDRGADRALLAMGEAIVANFADFVRFTVETPFNGFSMIPGGEPLRDQFIFNAVSVSRLIYLGAKFGGLSPRETLWEYPLAALGHLIACGADAEGQKGVGRPKDPDDIRRQLLAAKEREERGEKHPWQS